MIKRMMPEFKAKALRDGGLKNLLNFAVRGLPASYIAGEQRVDIVWAAQVYETELRQLDELALEPRWFWSGMLGAALLSLALWPGTIELWRRLANQVVNRDGGEADGACLLLELVCRHQNDVRVTRSPGFQLYIFQRAMAIVAACVHHGDFDWRFSGVPPAADLVALLEKVRKKKGQRHTKAGFRPAMVLNRFWVEPEDPRIIHEADLSKAYDLACYLADSEVDFKADPPTESALAGARDWLESLNIPNELAHPCALIAAILTIARYDNCWPVWEQALSGLGNRRPGERRQPLRDTATRIQDSIIDANRAKDPIEAGAQLILRSDMTIRRWRREGERFLPGLPKARKGDVVLKAILELSSIKFEPQLIFDPKPRSQLAMPYPEEDAVEKNEHPELRASTTRTSRKASGPRCLKAWP